MIRGYTREAGVRNLEREIGALCRKAARRRAEGNDEPLADHARAWSMEMLGAPRFLDEEMEERTKDPGVAIGLAWTPAGGDVLFIEASQMAGTGTLTLTGQLGDVMKESARAALSWLRAHAKELGIDPDFYKNAEIHLHVPSGAIPKDGPSAGVTMATALASELTRPSGARRLRDDRRDHAVGPGAAGRRDQGEGPRGATRRHPRSDPAAPEREERQRGSQPTELRRDLTIHLVSTIDEVLVLALTADRIRIDRLPFPPAFLRSQLEHRDSERCGVSGGAFFVPTYPTIDRAVTFLEVVGVAIRWASSSSYVPDRSNR